MGTPNKIQRLGRHGTRFLCTPGDKLRTASEILRSSYASTLFLYYVQSFFKNGPGQLSGYSDSLQGRRFENRIPVGARFSAPVQTGLGGPSSLLYNGYRLSFPGVNWPRRGVDHPPHLAPRLKKEQSYTSTAPLGLSGLFYGEIYLYLYLQNIFQNQYILLLHLRGYRARQTCNYHLLQLSGSGPDTLFRNVGSQPSTYGV